LIRFQEEERKRIAEDIHDTLTQSLTGIGYEALLCRKLVKNDTHRLRKELDKLIKQIDTTLTQSREITGCLRPKILDDIGIKAALKSLLRSFQKEQALKIEFSCPNKILIPPNIGISLFRILQEALQNIKKHSRANRVSVSLSLDSYGWLLFLIEDDGCGFDSKQGEKTSWDSGLGILLMEERAGELGGEMKIDSIPGKGCRLKIRIPLGDTKAEWKKLKY
jgi:two-component system sensor histidine kinase DegS